MGMFLVVSLQPVLSRVQFLGSLAGSDREVLAAHFEAEGDGVTAARVLRDLGHAVTLLGLGGRPLAELFEQALAEEGVRAKLLPTSAPLPMSIRHVSWSDGGELASSRFTEGAPRITGAEMRFLLAEAQDCLAEADALLVCGDSSSPGVDFAVRRLLERAGVARKRAILEASGRVLVESATAGPSFVVTVRRRLEATAKAHGLVVADLCRRFFDSGTQGMVLTDGVKAAEVLLAGETLRLQPPAAGDRGGERAREALAAGLLHGLSRDFEPPAAVAYGMGAATARVQKEIGGRLDPSAVEGFYRQVRRI